MIQDADIEKLRAENYRAVCLDNAEKQARLTEALKKINMEQKAKKARGPTNPGIELSSMGGQSESMENETEDQDSAHTWKT